MNRKILLLSLLLACVLRALPGFGQANSVELKTGTTVLSSHPTIKAAYLAIPATITQPYIIELTSTYTGATEAVPITFATRNGASVTNTITLRPAAGVYSINLAIAAAGTSLIVLDDTDYMILDGRPGGVGTSNAISLGNMAYATNSNTISLINGATHNVIRNINLHNNTFDYDGRNINLGASAANTSGNSNNQFLYLVANGGRININSNGTAANPNTRNRFYGCDVVNGVFAGIWYQTGTGSMTIDSCRVFHTNPVGDGTFGILFDDQRDTVVVTRNMIYDLDNGMKTSAVRGISIRSTLASGTTNFSQIVNNFIALSGNPASNNVVGLEYAGPNLINAQIYFNSIRISGIFTGTGSYGNMISAALSKTANSFSGLMLVRNNIFVNERTGGANGLDHVGLAHPTMVGSLRSDYNTFYATSGYLIKSGVSLYLTLSAYRSGPGLGNEFNSNVHVVQFASATDLHLTGTSVGNANFKGLQITGVFNDIDNHLRNPTPYRGADEANGLPAPPTVTSDLNYRSGVKIGVPENFNLTVTTGGSAGPLVKTRIALLNPAQAANINFSVEVSPGVFQPITFDASGVALIGPAAGIPLANASVAFRAIFNAVGMYSYSLALVDATSGTTVGTAATESVVILVNGLKENQLANAISVYPNPVSAQLTVKLTNLKNAEVTILDLAGKQLMASRPVTTEANLEVQSLAAGTYLLQVTTSQGVATKQFVIIK